jgi:hypothetical protein|tara:strand:- start:4568 stop:4888 length:321 start_codon:yes stop_codon:yes gene_type:complete
MSEVEKILTEIKEALLLEIRELRQEVEKLKKPAYGMTKNFSFPLDESNRFGGYHKTELSLPEIDPNFPIEQQLDDALANHVKATSDYLNTELNRQIMEIKGLDKEE